MRLCRDNGQSEVQVEVRRLSRGGGALREKVVAHGTITVSMAAPALQHSEYTSRLQKGGALVSEMRRLVVEWSDHPGAADRIVETNAIGSPSRARLRDVVVRTFIPRFVRSQPPDLWRSVAVLERAGWPASAIVPIHYYAAAVAEPLLWDFVTDVLADRFGRGLLDVGVDDAKNFLAAAPAARFAGGRWTPTVTTKVARGLLAALRDFGLLSGSVKKRLTPLYLPTETFAFLAMVRHENGMRGSGLLHDDAWRLFLLPDLAVERFFAEAHQRKMLTYHAAGSSVSVSFPSGTLEEYARELAEISR